MIIHPINNLRLLSVTLVLLYHYFPGRVPGGLIGVDIFFFISGYLMALLIDKNDNIAIVGESGCGKSTFTSLLLRFYDCDFGEILIDGVNIQDYNIQHLRH